MKLLYFLVFFLLTMNVAAALLLHEIIRWQIAHKKYIEYLDSEVTALREGMTILSAGKIQFVEDKTDWTGENIHG